MIRKATTADLPQLRRHLRPKNIEYATVRHLVSDVIHNRLYVMENTNGKFLAMCALVYDNTYQYYAIKRLIIFNKRNAGKGIARQMIQRIIRSNCSPLGCTPWDDNYAMQHLLESCGFTFQYTFQEHWMFYKKD